MRAFASRDEYRFGVAGESAIARWLRSRGFCVLPVYEKLIDDGKGPQLYLPQGTLIAPDLFVFNREKALWIEAKHKTAFSWYRIRRCWVTGIDLKHYEHYCRVDDETPWPVWLLFLHDGGQAKDSPANSPSGLFGRPLSYLREHESHRSDRHGRYGMVYWAHQDLLLLAKHVSDSSYLREPVQEYVA
jgi:hypothetical protein